ncbi:MAG: hypothetical protein J5623_02435 [Clostridiales bacterium]|nr:hypothetical protein [Clostridiales bacterium]
MAADIKFSVNSAINDQSLIPATISEELEQKFLRKAKASSIKLIPTSFLVAAVIIVIVFLLVYFLHFLVVSTLGFLCVIYPIYSIFDAIATSKAIKNHDYAFYYGEITGKTDNNNYIVKGLEEHKISVLFGQKEYNAGDRVIVARVKDDLSLISE